MWDGISIKSSQFKELLTAIKLIIIKQAAIVAHSYLMSFIENPLNKSEDVAKQ